MKPTKKPQLLTAEQSLAWVKATLIPATGEVLDSILWCAVNAEPWAVCVRLKGLPCPFQFTMRDEVLVGIRSEDRATGNRILRRLQTSDIALCEDYGDTHVSATVTQ